MADEPAPSPDAVVIAMFSRLVTEYSTTGTEFKALMAAETAGAFEAHQLAELERVTSLLKYSPSSLRLWRIPELKGFDGSN